MSRKTSIPQKRIHFDRGVQAYRSCDKDYSDSIRNTTFKEVRDAAGDARIIRESEFAKPYGEQYEEPYEDFWAMEYGAPDLPPWGWDYPDMEDPASRWKVVFFCDGTFDICYCNDVSASFPVNCSWEIIGAEFDPPWSDVGVSFDQNNIYTHGLATATGCGTLTITMKARFKVGEGYQTVIGTHSGIKVCACTEDECAECDDSTIAWDKVNSPDTVVPGNSVTVYIVDPLGTGGPYSWSIASLGGFSLQNAVTTGLSNVVNTTVGACGMGLITVTGCDGAQVVDAVRSTTGNWYVCGTFDYRGYGGGSCSHFQNSCAAGRYSYSRNSGPAGLFFVGCTIGGHTCAQQVFCAAGSVNLSVAMLASDPRAAPCTLPAGTCHDNNTFMTYRHWSC